MSTKFGPKFGRLRVKPARILWAAAIKKEAAPHGLQRSHRHQHTGAARWIAVAHALMPLQGRQRRQLRLFGKRAGPVGRYAGERGGPLWRREDDARYVFPRAPFVTLQVEAQAVPEATAIAAAAAAPSLRGANSTPAIASGGGCLCVFDIDRTLTGRQGLGPPGCPSNEVQRGVYDDAYGGGELTLSPLARSGLGGTACGGCRTRVAWRAQMAGAGAHSGCGARGAWRLGARRVRAEGATACGHGAHGVRTGRACLAGGARAARRGLSRGRRTHGARRPCDGRRATREQRGRARAARRVGGACASLEHRAGGARSAAGRGVRRRRAPCARGTPTCGARAASRRWRPTARVGARRAGGARAGDDRACRSNPDTSGVIRRSRAYTQRIGIVSHGTAGGRAMKDKIRSVIGGADDHWSTPHHIHSPLVIGCGYKPPCVQVGGVRGSCGGLEAGPGIFSLVPHTPGAGLVVVILRVRPESF